MLTPLSSLRFGCAIATLLLALPALALSAVLLRRYFAGEVAA